MGPRVLVRDHWRCAVPGCSSRAELHEHHVVFRSAGGSDAPENRITLCAFHHHRGVHAGRLRVRGWAPDRLVFELPLGRFRSGDVALTGGSGVACGSRGGAWARSAARFQRAV